MTQGSGLKTFFLKNPETQLGSIFASVGWLAVIVYHIG